MYLAKELNSEVVRLVRDRVQQWADDHQGALPIRAEWRQLINVDDLMEPEPGILRRANDIVRARLWSAVTQSPPDKLQSAIAAMRAQLLDRMQYESQIAALLVFYAEGQSGYSPADLAKLYAVKEAARTGTRTDAAIDAARARGVPADKRPQYPEFLPADENFRAMLTEGSGRWYRYQHSLQRAVAGFHLAQPALLAPQQTSRPGWARFVSSTSTVDPEASGQFLLVQYGEVGDKNAGGPRFLIGLWIPQSVLASPPPQLDAILWLHPMAISNPALYPQEEYPFGHKYPYALWDRGSAGRAERCRCRVQQQCPESRPAAGCRRRRHVLQQRSLAGQQLGNPAAVRAQGGMGDRRHREGLGGVARRPGRFRAERTGPAGVHLQVHVHRVMGSVGRRRAFRRAHPRGAEAADRDQRQGARVGGSRPSGPLVRRLDDDRVPESRRSRAARDRGG
ncbi:hypothetical protein Dvina_17635 [Dactylosporangium vinaceum]|uniref:Uncharacterized protein n=1 Tax=Dactylosporangium vinaceum TaxID=53362 RepID=A0ABV5M3B3_9ACTN|nr:hypothetical protein [Dactylosporangium vinaceum]UAB99722.1 hypothetical protein Dvina_17635 [Dactylosporangium vinaceum]